MFFPLSDSAQRTNICRTNFYMGMSGKLIGNLQPLN